MTDERAAALDDDKSAGSSSRGGVRLTFVLLALLAYLPPLRSAPGRMPADTKLFLYLNPDRLVSDSIWMWEPRQFGGWVPHQMVGYLWPAGPWFWTFEQLGIPDWIAHRLWIGTLLFAASTGMRWCARQLGLSQTAALVAALVYGLSPFLLAYVGRTSGLLLPWAGLGWMLGIMVRATRTEKARWREPAQLALVLACLGGLNATAIVLIAPPLLLWLLDSVLRGSISVRRCLTTVFQVTVLSIGTALWWLIGLVFQGRYGADVLAYTETLDAVNFTATGSEVLRGAGYWLFYVTERDGPLTIAADRYQTSWLTIGISLLIPALAMLGLIMNRWHARRFAGWCLLAGVVIAVGVHPIDSSSPLMAIVADHPTSSWALAMRSSTRAVPVVLIALALGLGALSTWLEGRLRSFQVPSRLGPIVLAGLAIANLPALWQGHLVNPVQSRDQDVPTAWRDVASALDEGVVRGGRVLQLPGTEFGVHRWGNLVDPLLPGITDRPIITRDLAPMGSPAAMDLLYALDDRVQDGTLEPASLAPVARLLGADDVLLVGDVAYERYRTRHPARVADLVDNAADIGPMMPFGPPEPNAARNVIDPTGLFARSESSPLSAVSLAPVEQSVPIVRAKEREVVVVGSGMGLVDAAGAGLINGTELVRYSASMAEPVEPKAGSSVIITDSNRKQAHQWRGSRDVLGMTEDIGPAVLHADLADHRLPVFPDLVAERMTTAAQVGPVQAIASAYGDPITYRPEDRAYFAVDGSASTSWRVADRGEPVGQYLRLSTTDGSPIADISLLQDQANGAGRWITEVSIRTAGGATAVALSDASRTGTGQAISLPVGTTDWVEIHIEATSTGRRDLYAGFGPVGFAEVGLDDREPTTEVVTLSRDTAHVTADTDDVSIVLSRWRAEATDPVRRDPEPDIRRRWALGAGGEYQMTGTIRLGARISDAQLAELLGFQAAVPVASASLPGEPRAGAWAAFDGDPQTGWISMPGDGSPALGVQLLESLTLDTVELALDISTARSVPTSAVVIGDRGPVETEMVEDENGRITLRFAEMSTSALLVQFENTGPFPTRDIRTGEAMRPPVEVTSMIIPGLSPITPEWSASGCRADLVSINSSPVSLRVEGDLQSLLDRQAISVELCDVSTIGLKNGPNTLATVGASVTGFDVDQIVLRSAASSAPGGALPSVRVVGSSRVTRTVDVAACPTGCWLVHGEGWSDGWEAVVDGGKALGTAELVDGGFNGWWLEPFTSPISVKIRWTPQSMMWPPLGLSLVATAGCCILALPRRGRRMVAHDPDAQLFAENVRRPGHSFDQPTARGTAHRARPSVWLALATVSLSALVVQPVWALAAATVVAVAWLLRRSSLIAWAGLGLVMSVAAMYIRRELVTNPFPGYGWIVNIDELHRPTMLAVVLLAVGLSASDESPATDHEVPSGSPATSTRG